MSPRMRNVWLALVVVLLCWGCARATPTPAPTPSPAPTPVVALTPAPAPESASAEVVFTSPRYGYTVTLPCCWLALPAPAAAVEAALAEIEGNGLNADLTALAERLRPQALGQVMELIAILPADPPNGAPQAQLTVSVLPRTGLTPAAYLDATRREFDLIAATRVQRAELDDTLRDNGLPAVVIEYTTASLPGGGIEVIAGLQVALLTDDGEDFIVLTFTTAEAEYPALLPQFREIVRLVEIARPA